MEARTQTPTIEESSIVERVARIVSSGHEWRGTKPDYTRLAAELEPAIPFNVFGIVLLRHDRQAVRITVCTRGADSSWVEQYHQHPLEDSMTQRMLQRPEMLVQNYPAGLDGPHAQSGSTRTGCCYRERPDRWQPRDPGPATSGPQTGLKRPRLDNGSLNYPASYRSWHCRGTTRFVCYRHTWPP